MSTNQKSRGPTPLLDSFQRGRICGMVAVGCSRREAAKTVGCHVRTIARTCGRDPQFARQLADAEALARARPLQAMYEAMGKHWRAAAWMLERTQSEQFSKRRPHTFTAAEVREVIDRLLEAAEPLLADEAARDQLRERADQFVEQIGQAPVENPLVEIEKMFDGLNEYKTQRDGHSPVNVAGSAARPRRP